MMLSHANTHIHRHPVVHLPPQAALQRLLALSREIRRTRLNLRAVPPGCVLETQRHRRDLAALRGERDELLSCASEETLDAFASLQAEQERGLDGLLDAMAAGDQDEDPERWDGMS